MDQNVTSDPKATHDAGHYFTPLKSLPSDMCSRSIYPFLDKKSLSTLFLALSSENSTKATEYRECIIKRARCGIASIQQEWQSELESMNDKYTPSAAAAAAAADNTDNDATSSSNGRRNNSVKQQVRPYMSAAVRCIFDFQMSQEEQNNQEDIAKQNRAVSEALIIEHTFSFPYHNLGRKVKQQQQQQELQQQQQQNRTTVPREWPIWCGRIEVLLWIPRGNFHGFERKILQANAMLLSPNWDLAHYSGWESVLERKNSSSNDSENKNTNPLRTIQLVAEAYNFLPTPPMGRLVGMTQKDQDVLRTIAGRLSDQNTVAILSRFMDAHKSLIDTVRILSRSQASERARTMPSLPFSFYVHHDDLANAAELDDAGQELLCCWQYRDMFDTTLQTTASKCIPYWKQLAQARDMCLQLEED